MRAVRNPVNEKQYAEAMESIEDFNPEIVILDMDFYMIMQKVMMHPVPAGKGIAQKGIEYFNKIDDYVKRKSKVYHLYVPEFASDVVREERARRTLIQGIQDQITGLWDAFYMLGMHLKISVYGYLKMHEKLAESSREFQRKIENKEFRTPLLNKLMEAWVYKRAYKINEIGKIVSENKGKKILYVGLKSDFPYLPLEQ